MADLYQKRDGVVKMIMASGGMSPDVVRRIEGAETGLVEHAAALATTAALGHVKPDGTTVAIAGDGALSVLNSPLWAGRAIYASTTDPDPATGNVGDFWLKIAE